MPKQTQTKKQKAEPQDDYYTDEWQEWTRAIRSLNDAFRLTFTSTELYCSPEILKFPVDDQASILERVRSYRSFNAVNDPNKLHNQGFFLYEEETIIWTIYYHGEGEERPHQLNPVEIDLTKRHMMIMTSSEWWEKLPDNIF